MTKIDEKLPTEKPTIGEHLKRAGVSRRNFMTLCSMLMVTAPVGLALTEKTSVTKIANTLA